MGLESFPTMLMLAPFIDISTNVWYILTNIREAIKVISTSKFSILKKVLLFFSFNEPIFKVENDRGPFLEFHRGYRKKHHECSAAHLQGGSGGPHKQSFPKNDVAGNFVAGIWPHR